jgi:hypothetical protein
MSLTYEDNDTAPVALINEDTFVYIDENELIGEEYENEQRKEEILDQVWDTNTINSIAESLESGMSLREIIDLFSSGDEEDKIPSSMNEIKLQPDEKIEVVPSPMNERIIIGGPAGSGKSYWAAMYARLWQKLHPDGLIHIFVRQADDPAYEGIEFEEIVVDDSILGRDLGIFDFIDTLVIFDDMDNLQDKDVIVYIHKLLNDLMACGRKQNIYVMYVTHIFKNRFKTQVALNESNKIVFFNGMGDRGNVGVLKDYAQMSKEEVNRLISVKSRWCCLERKRPRYVVHERGIFLV